MDINKLLKVLGFNLSSINDDKLRREFLNLLTKSLKTYSIDMTKAIKRNIGVKKKILSQQSSISTMMKYR